MTTGTDPPIVTRSQIARDLRRLGVRPGQVVMLHASVSALGWVVGGPDVVIRALLDVLTPEGTLMMLVSWEDAPYELARWPEERQRAYLEECPPFDPATSPAHRRWGILTEYLRTWPGACRSGHPECSFAAVGARADWITEDHPLQYGYGPGSPLAKLCEAGGRVLLLGAPLNTLTLLHYAEHQANVPNKRTVRYKMPVLRDGERVWVELEEFDPSEGIVDWEGGDYFPVIAREFLAAGRGRSGAVGAAQSHLFDAAALVEFGAQWMERTLGKAAGRGTGTLTIRQGTSDDIDAVLGLQERWDAEEITYGYQPNSREFVAGRLGPLFLVAAVARRVVAFAYGSIHVSEGLAVTPAGERYLEIDDLYVAPEFRSRGIGSRLLDALIETARADGVSRVHAFSATKDHDRLLRFYRDHGFRPWGVQLFR